MQIRFGGPIVDSLSNSAAHVGLGGDAAPAYPPGDAAGDPSFSQARVERMLSHALDEMKTGVYLVDHEWRLLFVNDVGRSFFPSRFRVQLGEQLWNVNPSLKDNQFGETILAAAEQRRAATVRAYSDRLKGWFEASTVPCDDGVVIYFRDVSAEIETGSLLDDTVKRLRQKAALLDAARDAIFVCELDDSISFWNRGAESLYGWRSDEATGLSARDLLQYSREDYDERRAAVLRDGEWAGEILQVTRTGATFVGDARWQLTRDDEGAPAFILCVVIDVTQIRREQEEVYRAQRMESLGTLAGGIAHDLNNVLTPILISSQLLERDEHDPTRREVLGNIESSAKRGADMIRQVLSFARGEEIEHTAVDISALIDELTVFCRNAVPQTITVSVQVGDNLARVDGDSTQIFQVLMNLVTNSRDAIAGSGTITIRATNLPATSDGDPTSASSDRVMIEVEDSGSGMETDVLTRAFEPFFSTKAAGEGTGLGLSTSVAIVRAHGGFFDVTSTPGVGTRFRVLLPAASASAYASASASGEHPVAESQPGSIEHLQGDGETVLVVDDEDTIRSIVQRTLETNGYRTIAARNGIEAIEQVETGAAPVDLVLTDMMMPIMGGAATATYLAQHHPSLPVIAASGFAAGAQVAAAQEVGVDRFLAKPFSTEELLIAVRAAISR